MEDSVKVLIDGLIEQAKAEAKVLADQLEAQGQIPLPQLLAEATWTTDKGEEVAFAIILELSRSDIGRQLGKTSLLLFTEYDGKFLIDNFRSGTFGYFAETVLSQEFRTEAEQLIEGLTANDGNRLFTSIANKGICAVESLIVPEKVQMDIRRLPAVCTLSVYGAVFEGIDGIMDYVHKQTNSSQPYIVEHGQRFPCFDSEDYANERRFYRNFLICHSKQEAEKKAKKMARVEANYNFCLTHKNLPADTRPMVYYEDESMSMLLAY